MPMLTFPMIFLSGVFSPVETGPRWMSVIAKINPATYGVAIIRQVTLGVTDFKLSLFGHTLSIWNDAGILAAFGAVMILLAMWSFSSQD
jgi:ABC-type multidrug transport system permease subunit